MPRAGSGGRRTSGGRASSRTSGGHRISSGSRRSARASGISLGSSHYRSASSHRAASRRSHRPHVCSSAPANNTGYSYRSHSSSSKTFASVLTLFLVLFVIFKVLTSAVGQTKTSSSDSISITANTRNREKLDSGLTFDSHCIVDEIGWFDSVASTGTKLKTFYDLTGVQPWIVLLDYHSELVTDAQKEAFAQDYYEEYIDNEATFLYMYFAEEDIDNAGGYMCYVNGRQVDSVMDEEAVNIFWDCLDRSWYSDLSTDALFADAFERTARAIMSK